MRALAFAVGVLMSGSAWAASNPAETVPFDHWAYDALQELVDAGVIIHGPDSPGVTPHEWSLALFHLAQSLGKPGPDAPDRYAPEEKVASAVATLVRAYWPDIEEAVAQQGQGSRETLRRWLAGIPPGNWLHETAQAILRDHFRKGAAADPTERLPFDHWAYDAMSKLVDVGLLPPYPSDPFGHDRQSTRYEFAASVARALDIPQVMAAPGPRPPFPTNEGSRAALQLLREFWPEIELILGGQGLASTRSLREGLARIRAGNWLYQTAQAILRDHYGEAAVAKPFPDVPRDHWAFGAVERLRVAGIVMGYPDGTFSGSTVTVP